MTTEQRVSKLQGLLERITKNAARPRASATLRPPVADAAVPPLPAAPPPVAAAAPPVYTPPAPAAYVPPPVLLDDSVDDLLGLSAEASPPPLAVDIPLDTLPPVAEVAAAPSSVPEADPIPLVAVAAHESPLEDPFSLDSEVSEVRVAAIPREVEEVTVAAIEAEAEPIVAEELSDDDLVDVTEGTPLPSTADSLDFEDEDERAPASSQRIASTMDEALAAAAEQADAEREVPLKTPPPESGPQEAPLGAGFAAAPAAPDVSSLLGEELDIPTRGEAATPSTLVPRPEQLGQTIDLEEARGPLLELAEPVPSAAPPAAEELEVALPEREVVGGYDDQLPPPPEALDELEAHRRRLEEDIAPPPESLATLPSVQPGAAPEILPIVPLEAAPFVAQPVDVAPEALARSAPMGEPESFTSVRETFRPSTFVELLDASLSLGG